ncbi:MAG: lytic transglycosylase domain-containing protein [Novosphingobium sp.]
MSSMVRTANHRPSHQAGHRAGHRARILCLLLAAVVIVPVAAQNVSVPVIQALPPGYNGPAVVPTATPQTIQMVGKGGEWDEARAQLRLGGPTQMAQAVDRWRQLTSFEGQGFAELSGFLLAYPGFPDEEKLRRKAEAALDRAGAEPSRIAAYFDRVAPLTNQGRAQYALALSAMGRGDALAQAMAAWRGGVVSDAAEPALAAMLAGRITPADQDARMDALLWAGANAQAQRQIVNVSGEAREVLTARLAALQGNTPYDAGYMPPAAALNDTGWIYNRARQLGRLGQNQAAGAMLAVRQPLTRLPTDPAKWVDLQLDAARASDARTAMQIAGRIDDAFAPGTDVSRLGFGLRDNYTSLMWLAANKALNSLGEPRAAASLFYRYGAAARTPQTRSKGFYWAARAIVAAGEPDTAKRYFEAAAAYPDQFYGQLSLERLGRPLPALDTKSKASPTPDEQRAFVAKPITAAVREVAREADWPTAVRFFREISEQAVTEGDHVLVANLARELGRRDLGVILGQSAHTDGFGNFRSTSFPLIPVPQGSDWTMVHAISRQESQFAANAVSHAGARGLMQLMPATARQEAGKLGLPFTPTALTSDPSFNLRLGDSFFAGLMRYYQGSYPLAVAGYNAGPGNVNKWLRANGDPRTGTVEWIDWIERIPISETRGYVQHVLENAVVYEAMNPDMARYKGANPLSHFIGKRTAG